VVFIDPVSHKEQDRFFLDVVGPSRFESNVHGVEPLQPYLLRVEGPWDPDRGAFCHPNFGLIDPRARVVSGRPDLARIREVTTLADGRLNAPPSVPHFGVGLYGATPSSVAFDWSNDEAPQHRSSGRVIYECHVGSATKGMTTLPTAIRGSYLGIAHDSFLDRLVQMGVTTLELLPIASMVDETALLARGMRNVWGYNPVNFFALSERYGVIGDPRPIDVQFKELVQACHARSIEVIVDVVFNHTAESDLTGPLLSLRGIDNAVYYRNERDGSLTNWTGTGNTLNLSEATTLRLVMDALRFWVEEFHVDGFRFDLAPALSQHPAIPGHAAPDQSMLFSAIAQDPRLADLVLIAEPWDATFEGQFLGRFPSPFGEWNGRFRDDSRRFWSAQGTFGEAVRRFAGSDDLFQRDVRRVRESVNFIASHDGFTTYDLTRYRSKRNWPNGWNNTDGASYELTIRTDLDEDDASASAEELRQRTVRSVLTWLLLSLGTPMLLFGDETYRTQLGNNNAYCIDDPSVWTNLEGEQIVAYIGRLVELRRRFGIGERSGWYEPRSSDPSGPFDPLRDDIEFYRADGSLFDEVSWNAPIDGALGIMMSPVTKDGAVLFVGFNPTNQFTTLTIPECDGIEDLAVAVESEVTLGERARIPCGTQVRLTAKGALVATGVGKTTLIV
jgi:glycogen operon protein